MKFKIIILFRKQEEISNNEVAEGIVALFKSMGKNLYYLSPHFYLCGLFGSPKERVPHFFELS